MVTKLLTLPGRQRKTPDLGGDPGFFCSGSDRSRDQSAVDGVTGNATDVFAANAEVAEFAVRHAAEFGDGLTILAPIVERACYVHDDPLS